MARLPTPGSDDNIWGSVLNGYLGVSLNDDGTLQDNVVSNAQVSSGAAIAEAKLNLASDAAAGVPSRRTLGTGATQAAAGNDARIVGAEQVAHKGQANGYPGLDGTGNLDIIGVSMRVGPADFPYATIDTHNGPSNAYVMIDKDDVNADATVLFRDQGNIRAEIGMASDDDIHFKTVTGTYGAEAFTDRLIIRSADGKVWVPNNIGGYGLGVGTVPTEILHIADAQTGSRPILKAENTSVTGSSGAAIELTGTGVDWAIGTDAGLNGGNNFFIQDNNAGYPPRVLIDGSGNVAVGKDNATYKLDVVGDIASSVAGSGFRIKEGTNAKMGTAVLVNGAVVVANTSVTTSSRIFLTIQAPGGAVGTPYVSARTAGTSFSITSTSNTDGSTVAWVLIEPS